MSALLAVLAVAMAGCGSQDADGTQQPPADPDPTATSGPVAPTPPSAILTPEAPEATSTTAPTVTPTAQRTCRADADGFVVTHPSDWHTIEAGAAEPCRWFHPEPFEPPSPAGTFQLDPRIAVQLQLTGEPFASAVSGLTEAADHAEMLSKQDTTVAGQPAVRVEWRAVGDVWGLTAGTRVTQYLADLGSRTLHASTPASATAGTYEGNQAALDGLMASLELLGSGNDDCSAVQAGVAAPDEQAGLPQPVAETRRVIAHAAAHCDYERLAELAAEGFSYSFGESGHPGEFWRRQEAEGREPLRYLVELLDRPHATVTTADTTLHVWPSAFAYDTWQEVPEADREALRPLYDEEDFAGFQQFGGYIGYRVGIAPDGRWQFFVTGD